MLSERLYFNGFLSLQVYKPSFKKQRLEQLIIDCYMYTNAKKRPLAEKNIIREVIMPKLYNIYVYMHIGIKIKTLITFVCIVLPKTPQVA